MRRSSFRAFIYFLSFTGLFAWSGVLPGPANVGATVGMAQSASDPVIAAAGDIACDPASDNFNGGEGTSTNCHQMYTSDLLVDADLAAVLPLGDIQYYCGGYDAFLHSYDPSWGRVRSITRPVIGNHEYLTEGGTDCTPENEGGAGYFQYFGEAAGEPGKGYYSYNIGEWHLVALNSNCGDAGGCDHGSPQMHWLMADLAANRHLCTLAYWHIPLFSSGGRSSDNTRDLWEVLYANDVELVLSGHDHTYERFAPQTADGVLDRERGIRQFVVGTGGSNHTDFEEIFPNSEVRHTGTYGVLMLTLRSGSYDWNFVPEAGGTFTDSGSEVCHGTPPATPVPTTTPLPTPTATPTIPTESFTFAPEADAYVSKVLPGVNFGASNMLRVYGGPLGASYIRFTVTGLTGRVKQATLRMYAHNGSNAGYQVRVVNDHSWHEAKMTYENAPPVGDDLLIVSEPFQAKEWTTVDVTPLIRGNGTYSLMLISFDGAPLSLASRNAIPPYQPHLVVDVFK